MPNTGEEDLVSCAFGGHATAGRMQKDSVEVPRLAVTLQCVGPVSLVNKASVLVFACSLQARFEPHHYGSGNRDGVAAELIYQLKTR